MSRPSVFGSPLFLGFDHLEQMLDRVAKNADGYPPYNIEQTGAKATAMLNLVKQLLADGVPLDGVGFQCHFIVGEVPTSLQTVMEQFTALGLEVAITELDIRMPTPASQANLAQQQKDYQSVVQACMNVEGCVGITVWDFTDKVCVRDATIVSSI